MMSLSSLADARYRPSFDHRTQFTHAASQKHFSQQHVKHTILHKEDASEMRTVTLKGCDMPICKVELLQITEVILAGCQVTMLSTPVQDTN